LGPGPGEVGQGGLKVLVTKNPHPQPKKFFRGQTKRLAKSFKPLNSSLPLSVPELRSRKAMYDQFFMARNPLTLPDAKELNQSTKINFDKYLTVTIHTTHIRAYISNFLFLLHLSTEHAV